MSKIEISDATYMDIQKLEFIRQTSPRVERELSVLASLGIKLFVIYDTKKDEFKKIGVSFSDDDPELENQPAYIKYCIELLARPPEHQTITTFEDGHEQIDIEWSEDVLKRISEAKLIVESFIEKVKLHLEISKKLVDKSLETFWTSPREGEE